MASKFMLCSFKTCPWVQRAAIVLQAKKIPYDITYIDRNNRPAWFLAISPHSKVPVVQIDGKEALFESNAIAEYLEETVAPRLHPEDPIARARNRAWTDYVTDVRIRDLEHGVFEFGAGVCGERGEDRRSVRQARGSAGEARQSGALFQRAEDVARRCGLRAVPPALHVHGPAEVRSASSRSSRCSPHGATRCMAAPAVKSSTVDNFEAVWQENLIVHKRWLSKFVPESVIGAGAAA